MADETTTRAQGLSPIDFSAPVTSDASASAGGAAGATNAGGAACSRCATTLTGYYYESAGAVYCPKCKHAAESAAGAQGGGRGGMGRAALFGFGAAIVGAIGYWAFIKITDFDWALVSIAVGMLVATAIRKGNGNRGGRRFQFLAVALTYFAIGGAYAPFALEGVIDGMKKGEAQHAPAAASPAGAARPEAATPAAAAEEVGDVAAAKVVGASGESGKARPAAGATKEKPSATKAVLFLLVGAVLLVIATPVVIIAGGFPGSIINILIVGFALRRAWQMTDAGVGVAVPTFSGPYNVKSRPAVAAHGG
jgi:hypothetical protein